MKHMIWPETRIINDEIPTLTPYLVREGMHGGGIIVCPGGGYQRRAEHEGVPVARWLNSLGINAFVLDYRVSPAKHPAPLADAQRAIRFIRYYAKEWNIDKERIGILGFSAGGHLAASLSNLSDYPAYENMDVIDEESSKPDISILCYPVISMIEYTHEGSVTSLLGEGVTDKDLYLLSHQRNVSKETPPTFLWHTADDKAVPVENSIMYAQALSKAQIPYELHIFQQGRHGLGLSKEDQDVAQWTNVCAGWLRKQGYGTF
ncbi:MULTISPECIES: alpha/beta hydrolase [unclassified Bacillus (in: firmicutes)]|uniref:alpha/beta hydrolase n=1 Tax=unclassified Bacillus (in: firmicutes) TaxID=185979 RepID=UPI00080AF031|nr:MULTISPECIES: alpha/beta hydrolase [unclassified Bacillus (in: firmicutes)]OCA89386.1 esterase [Bacillus sp. FJAT-27986]